MKQNGIKHTLVPPYHPASSGAAERTVQIVKKTIRFESTNEQIHNYRWHGCRTSYHTYWEVLEHTRKCLPSVLTSLTELGGDVISGYERFLCVVISSKTVAYLHITSLSIHVGV